MIVILTEEERNFLSTEITRIYQDYNLRTLYDTIGKLTSVKTKLAVTNLELDELEDRLLQFLLKGRSEELARLTDQRLQFILQEQNNQGFTAPGDSGGTNRSHFFHSGKQYQLCLSILGKL